MDKDDGIVVQCMCFCCFRLRGQPMSTVSAVPFSIFLTQNTVVLLTGDLISDTITWKNLELGGKSGMKTQLS